ncbi:MAG: hypothetical protein Q8S21_06070 [Candidatus Paracaedibacteraceae bacterium]|nr:hypothetical protein [Candidatus Paracaedibacteraceae bacterium]
MFISSFKKTIAFYFLLIAIIYQSITPVSALAVKDLILSNGLITETMVEILGQAGVRIKGRKPKANWPAMMIELESSSCKDVTRLIQGKAPHHPNYSWRATPDIERWEMSAKNPNTVNMQAIMDLILKPKNNGVKGLNMGAETNPKRSTYSQILLLGSTIGDFNKRIGFLNNLCDKDALHLDEATKMYILTGKRSFNAQEKVFLQQLNTPDALNILNSDCERNAMEWCYKTIKTPKLSKQEMIIIDDANPTGPRASTQSTLALFFDHDKANKKDWKHKKILLVSSHIFALYQYLIAKRVAFDQGFDGEIDVCAGSLADSERNAYPDNTKLAMLLDNLARIFYEICQYKEVTGKYPS